MAENVPALTWDSGKFAFHKKLGDFVQYFQVNLPNNGYGVPLEIVDPTIIAENMLNCQSTDDMDDQAVQKAIRTVNIEDGLPMVEGLPIWERLEGEIYDYYKLFKEYREMLYATGSRSLARLGDQVNITPKNLSVLSKVYHWQQRVRAFDLYKKMERERKRQFEIQKLQSRHSKVADSLLERSLTYLEQHPEQLNPQTAIKMLEVAMKTGRLSLGLNCDKPCEADVGSAPNINIQQVNNSQTESATGEDSGTRREVGNTRAKGTSEEDMGYMKSLLHVLDKSGALDQAKKDIIEGDFTEVDDEDDETSAVEGT